MQQDELITIRQFDDPEEASNASILLECDGIETSLINVLFEKESWCLVNDAEPACLQVRATDVDFAESLLNDPENPSAEEKALEEVRLRKTAQRQEEALADLKARIDANPDELVTLRQYWDPIEANLAANLLESNEIFTSLTNEALAQNAWHMSSATNGVGLQVRVEDVQQAESLLNDIDESSPEEEAETWYAKIPKTSEEFAYEARKQATIAFCISCFIGLGTIMAIFPLMKSYKAIEAARDRAEPDGLSEKAERMVRIARLLNCILIALYMFGALFWTYFWIR